MKRKVLVIGSGGREAVTVWKIKDCLDPNVEIHCAPGNAGMEPMAKLHDVKTNDIDGLCALAEKLRPDIVIPGPEEPLVLGIADRLSTLGIACVGPSAKAARLEGSKVFAKRFMRRHNIRTAHFRVFDDLNEALQNIIGMFHDYDGLPDSPAIVIKTDGLCGGKGVLIPANEEDAVEGINDIMEKKKFGSAGDRIVVEERLRGHECSFIVLTDGKNVVPLLPAVDYKRRFEGDEGPNTGGMGAYCPNPLITPNLHEEIIEDIVLPTIRGMTYEGNPYRGFLYFGLMITENGPYVLEYNVRMGDPEASVILPLVDCDITELLIAAATGDISGIELKWKNAAAVAVVLTAENYPKGKSEGASIYGLTEARSLGALVFSAGVLPPKIFGQPLITYGGRILEVVGVGKDFTTARGIAYAGAEVIQFRDKAYRPDIAARLIK
ncbi:MAG: phosphoribosylamine--glycine ligase [Candidatus Ryanbacteria bacterium RIFCSPLOWO2_01_FULL_48_26]|uniref:Phosphoribosylamine--glycine ligase n=1 Tax=Candidatus Ryanbacteria bacterium RIFCSPLOWO2_01_FULL_48_26 TaxID=1802126 RepID=A0A1G2GRF4_9BACT|nr:MAG: phosphoribosylamine--glycine ligase [Candidatus Ryanbacteria bacterium RIFCSPLOWO2_01_FULL_48_26]